MSLRKRAPAARRRSTSPGRSATSSWNRFHSAGLRTPAVGEDLPAAPRPLGALRRRRRSPRDSIAKDGCRVHVDREARARHGRKAIAASTSSTM
jgi:hypothetical protein